MQEGAIASSCFTFETMVETTGIEPTSKYWFFNVSENRADSFADSAVGLSNTKFLYIPAHWLISFRVQKYFAINARLS